MDDRILYYIWLSSSLRPGSKTPKILLEHFGDILKIYNAGKKDYEALAISESEIICLCNKNLENAKKYYEYCKSNNIGILEYTNPCYPERLKIIDNPPAMFYYKGRLCQLDDYPCITMVGTRSCSEKGFRLAYETAYDAASKGAVIVNGLALGIDGACIKGALDANGYAIGLLGCGIDRIYPWGNKDLFEKLSASGLILTEFSPFTEPKGENFPVRNRVISAMSLATVVFEAGQGSGALITAKHALSQGRRIFAVPGKPYDKSYSGPLELIKDGATVFTEADDVLTEYSMSFPHRINLANKNDVPKDKLDNYVARYFKKDVDPDTPVNRRFTKEKQKKTDRPSEKTSKESKTDVSINNHVPQSSIQEPEKKSVEPENQQNVSTDLSILSSTERKIYDIIFSHGSMTPDEIAGMGVKIDDILSALTLLEIYGLIKALPGGKYEYIK